MDIFVLIVFAFIGYVVGRISHIVGGQLGDRGIDVKYWPHHWVFGVLAAIIGVIFYKQDLGKWLVAFGVGHIISDWNDLLKGRVFDTSEEPEIKKFWGID